MGLAIKKDGDVQVLCIDGELDAFEVQTIRSQLEEALKQPAKLIAVDATDLTMVDSSGIGLLVYMFKQASANNIKYALTNLRGQPAEMISFLKIDRRVPVHASVSEARQALLTE